MPEDTMSTTLQCSNLTKVYPNQDRYALGDEAAGVSFEVQHGELFALLGPSGCGKTTTLRIIGGFVEPTSGTVRIDGRDVTDQAPYKRPTNTVFQSYALFPHMDVGTNVAFGLKMEGVGSREREQRAQEALELVGLSGMAKRKVSELSGGQQQRAALARAIVKQPAVLLLDEPLGALDLKLRRQMQDEIVRLKRSTKTTFVHVTHDQEEACAIADRIAVMGEGKIIQVDSPLDLYRSPRTAYVAEFIDAGTIVRGEVRRPAGQIEVQHEDLCLRGPAPATNGSGPMAALIPHDRVRVLPGGAAGDGGPIGATGTVERALFTGSVFDITVRIGASLELRAAVSPDEVAAGGAESFAVGRPVSLSWRPEDIVFVEDD
jgi:ABC-type Fe3+/spermidine/putrescine transport system ATPase subunit